MLKIVDARLHGVLDYALALAFLFAPLVLTFGREASILSVTSGVAYLVLALVTRYPFGALKLLPFPVHGYLEAIMAGCWAFVPAVFGFSRYGAAVNFFVAASFLLLALVAVTDYRFAAPQRYHGPERRAGADRRTRTVEVARQRRRSMGDRRALATQ